MTLLNTSRYANMRLNCLGKSWLSAMRPRATHASLNVLCTMPFTDLRPSCQVAQQTWRRICRWNCSWSWGLILTLKLWNGPRWILHVFSTVFSQECVEMMSAHKIIWNLVFLVDSKPPCQLCISLGSRKGLFFSAFLKDNLPKISSLQWQPLYRVLLILHRKGDVSHSLSMR